MEPCGTVSEEGLRKGRNPLMIGGRLPLSQETALNGDLPCCSVLMLGPMEQQVEMSVEPSATLSWQGVLSGTDPGSRGTNPLMITRKIRLRYRL
jgi:hypothetical protein